MKNKESFKLVAFIVFVQFRRDQQDSAILLPPVSPGIELKTRERNLKI